jgi:hypothetical protein
VAQQEDGVTTFYVNAGAGIEGHIFQTDSAMVVASVFHFAQTKGVPVQKVQLDILTASASAQVETMAGFPVFVGAEAGAYLMKADAGAFHGALGVAADTGIGCKDQSFGCKVLGCGVRVGRVCEISAFGSGIGIDWGKLF